MDLPVKPEDDKAAPEDDKAAPEDDKAAPEDDKAAPENVRAHHRHCPALCRAIHHADVLYLV